MIVFKAEYGVFTVISVKHSPLQGEHIMGVSYKGGTTYYHSIADNISEASKRYPYEKGYFGKEGNNKKIRIIVSNNPAKTGLDFYNIIAHGGIEEKLPNGKGVKTSLADGTIITFRPTTKSDSNPGDQL